MGDVGYFLGTTFTWIKHKDRNISAHLRQLEFTEFAAHRFSVQSANKVTNMTPYRSGSPIDSIPTVDPLYHDTTRRRQVYQRNVVCINWIVTFTCTDIPPSLTFLDLYSNSPHPQHHKAAVIAIKYLTITNEYGI